MFFLQRTFTSLVQTHAGRTQKQSPDALRFVIIFAKEKAQKLNQSYPMRRCRRYNKTKLEHALKLNNIIAVIFLVISGAAFAADGKGKISSVFFAGQANGSHPNVVQFKIEGGYNRAGCNQVFAAVRAEDSHLVSAVLAAKMAGSVVEVYLNPSDIYYNVSGNESSRCVATAISIP